MEKKKQVGANIYIYTKFVLKKYKKLKKHKNCIANLEKKPQESQVFMAARITQKNPRNPARTVLGLWPVARWLVFRFHSSKVPGSILSSCYSLCGVSVHVLHMCTRGSSGFSGFLLPLKNVPVGVLATQCESVRLQGQQYSDIKTILRLRN